MGAAVRPMHGPRLTRRTLGRRSLTYPAPRRNRRGAEQALDRQLSLPVVSERTVLTWADGEPATFPRTRGECAEGPRPCPWVRCRYHLAGEVKPNGALKLYHPELGLEELPDTCALDVADRGAQTLDVVAARLNIVGERARQIADEARAKVVRAVEGDQDDEE